MKETLITTLRDRNSTIEQYRHATDLLATVMAIECDQLFPKTTIEVETPLALTQGCCFKHEPLLVPILRSGLVMLSPFLRFYPRASVGFIGARRDEVTAEASIYYSNVPVFTKEQPILLLDPMIATGGSASMAVDVLKKAGALEKQITLIGFIAAPEGLEHFQRSFPEVGLMMAQVDDHLDEHKWIVPGLGDFGDRYFGTPTGSENHQ